MPSPVLGITGLAGSGKSAAAAVLGRLHGTVVDADRVGHEVLEDDGVRTRLVEAFGPGILSGGRIDRGLLAAQAFAGPDAPARLNAISHPAMAERLRRALSAPLPAGRYHVLEAAVLFEAGFDRFCDLTVCLQAGFAARERRLGPRGWDADELRARDRAQDGALKEARAHLLLDAERDLAAVERLFLELDLALRLQAIQGYRGEELALAVARFLRDTFGRTPCRDNRQSFP